VSSILMDSIQTIAYRVIDRLTRKEHR